MSLLSQSHLQNEGAACAWVEARVWPEGAVCAHCGVQERVRGYGRKEAALSPVERGGEVRSFA